MPPSTTGPAPLKGSKRVMSDAESQPRHQKKPRRNSSPEPRRESNRDSKRRRKRKKKVPLMTAVDKNQPTLDLPDDRSRAPLSARNETIRFSSAPSEAGPATTQPSSSKTLQGSLHTTRVMPSDPNDKVRTATAPGPSSTSLEEKVARLEADLKSKNTLIASHQALLNQVQQAVTCQVCLDLMYRPYALAPCGHLACHACLVNWFTAPPPDNQAAPPSIKRKKTCPHCRAVVRERPIEVWGVKSIAQATGKSGLLQNQSPLAVEDHDNLNANNDPWKDIFPKPGATDHAFPSFFPRADVDDDDDAHIPPRGEDVGMFDMEDGGIYRCLDCMHEIWDGVCTSCGRVYPGHAPQGDDDDDERDPMGWLENQVGGAEEVDVADDPGWMGLEDGEADDDGDHDWRPFEPWRRRFHMLRGPWGFLGAIHVEGEDDEEDEDDDMYGGADGPRVADEVDRSDDEGYESSFIDDDDDDRRDGILELEAGPRIYEIGDDGDDDDDDDGYRSDQHSHIADLVSDEDEQGGSSGGFVESDDSDA